MSDPDKAQQILAVAYDATANAAYIRLSPGPVVESQEASPGVVFDYDARGHIVGIEVLDARMRLSPGLLDDAISPRS
ncbi:Uncharacterized protein YuzE [Devosia enhydra]|uniref:Uncharacterized protein YuzE n=1 Tax=Devosia enhydra TaxID=665118 RepID=A0A1K2HYG1_9HYPH|nr:DUF2283 domain-containing protein [Devosia enhydra]SFZ84992.1 Uncharacterized protein YuzE [Devosia enhydra]